MQYRRKVSVNGYTLEEISPNIVELSADCLTFVSWPTLRELVRRYELLSSYTPDPDIVAAEDAG